MLNKIGIGNNRRGQMMMVGIMILIMVVLIFIATLPAVSNVMDDARGCDSLNCAGFVDQSASGDGCSNLNKSYLPNGKDNALTCTIMDLFLPFLILGVLIGLITALLHGRLAQDAQPQYGGYPGQY